jgi:hypothetical protein
MRFGVRNEEKALPSLYEAELLHSSFVCSNALPSEVIFITKDGSYFKKDCSPPQSRSGSIGASHEIKERIIS